eukprot:TRINITY_DN3165_c0_g1_i3.p1 TRINITY_DN3165_c0_g1~~TRINITY_DN3165_c0_g1_i3.p1  ORF type:complete len:241 (+),score=31.80 TRINITY_DN3165_c0_g1_i3:412-1134(+)
MVMATKISALPSYPENIVLLPSKGLRARFVAVGCLQPTSIGFCRRLHPYLCLFQVAMPPSINSSRRQDWSVRSNVNDGISDPSGSSTDGRSRLVKAIRDFQIKLNTRVNDLKKSFPMKVLFFLVGFYCATAFATVIGQTGDWDILSAGLAVVVVEGIGALMYKASFPMFEKLRTLITMFNYWKAGLSLGLFLDAFKYQIDTILESCNPCFFLDTIIYEMEKILDSCKPFKFEIDVLPLFW